MGEAHKGAPKLICLTPRLPKGDLCKSYIPASTDHAEEFGVDPGRLLTGSWAGANLFSVQTRGGLSGVSWLWESFCGLPHLEGVRESSPYSSSWISTMLPV